jgi:predicted metal-binding protein
MCVRARERVPALSLFLHPCRFCPDSVCDSLATNPFAANTLVKNTTHSAEGRVTPRTRWRDYAPSVEGEPAYVAVARAQREGHRPKDVFAVRAVRCVCACDR